MTKDVFCRVHSGNSTGHPIWAAFRPEIGLFTKGAALHLQCDARLVQE